MLAIILNILSFVWAAFCVISGAFICLIFTMAWAQTEAETAAKQKEMEGWSIKRLHAYAGHPDHPKKMKEFAYKLAKKKTYEKFDR
jgi:hypothetical protein